MHGARDRQALLWPEGPSDPPLSPSPVSSTFPCLDPAANRLTGCTSLVPDLWRIRTSWPWERPSVKPRRLKRQLAAVVAPRGDKSVGRLVVVLVVVVLVVVVAASDPLERGRSGGGGGGG